MTGPDGEQFHGYWTVVNVDPPNGFEIKDAYRSGWLVVVASLIATAVSWIIGLRLI